jgi:hypothetical protein
VIDGLMLKHQAQTWGQRRALAPVIPPTARSDAAQRMQRTPTPKRKTAR